jgi:hypothetical protein
MNNLKQIAAGMTLLTLATSIWLVGFKNAEAVSSTVTVTVRNSSVSSAGTYTTGGGTIIADDGGISCGADCTETYAKGQTVVLRATPAAGYKFGGWLYNPCPEGLMSLVCTATLNDPYGSGTASYTAQWRLTSMPVTVQKSGTGSGTVTGSGMNCGATCSITAADGAAVSFTATPAAGSKFVGWVPGELSVCMIGGGKAGSSTNTSPTCSITIDTGRGGAVLRPQFDAIPGAVTTTPTTTPSPTSPTPTTPPVVTTEDAPTIDQKPIVGLLLNDKTYSDKQTPKLTGKVVTLQGKTLPNAVVKLFIFSTPREASATADADGMWKYEVTGLESGDHRVEAQVTDPATQKVSARTVIARFAVAGAAAVAAQKVTTEQGSGLPLVGIGGLVAAILAVVAGVVLYRKKHPKSPEEPQTTSFDDSSTPDTAEPISSAPDDEGSKAVNTPKED